ncbi:MAG: glycoside hydrolase family 31 protein [Candidatus Wallbacteria bacterium]|nr:glycoside hydrolase family 31 protein [Candidatus Wallbacteria bacterium]
MRSRRDGSLASRSSRGGTASSGSIVIHGNLRLTVLTQSIIRIEWHPQGLFEDRLSSAVSNRNLDVPQFERFDDSGILRLKTPAVAVDYSGKGSMPDEHNFSVRFDCGGVQGCWRPGLPDSGNLLGTARTLDSFKGCFKQLGQGFLSRNGWVLIDDSGTPVIDKGWVTARTEAGFDWYLLCHGRDYKKALFEASLIFGRQPLPPVWSLGYWWSRYWHYTGAELETLVAEHETHGIPLSVLVIDMDWHKEGWTGFTWDERLFPDWRGFLVRMKKSGLKITLNLHPAEGVGAHEEAFQDLERALGLPHDPLRRISFDCTDRGFMKAFFDVVLGPLENSGVDFWWLDWQQGDRSSMPGLDPLPWLNRLFFENMAGNPGSARPMIFSRYGGLGSGRYPLGFSGDTYANWDALDYLPFFTATAANALFGYWSHDIGGHFVERNDPELYTRWVQYGVFSPVLRTHVTKAHFAERRLWNYPEPYSAIMRSAVHRRYHMLPYIYTECRRAYDTGVSICRPLYYDWPEEDEAYRNMNSYCFGDEMLVCPVTRPVEAETGLCRLKIWLPPGEWYDETAGELLHGGRTIERYYSIDEIPVFIKSGSVIPGQLSLGPIKSGGFDPLSFSIYPGCSGEYTLYEDDGVSNAYPAEKQLRIELNHVAGPCGDELLLKSAAGSYRGFRKAREVEVHFYRKSPPSSVLWDGALLPFSNVREGPCWAYDGNELCVILKPGRVDITRDHCARIESSSVEDSSLNGWRGIMKRMKTVYSLASLAFCGLPGERELADAALTGKRISLCPETLEGEMRRFRERLPGLELILKQLQESTGTARMRSQTAKAQAVFSLLR